MARISYGGLAKAIKTVIAADPSVRDYDATSEVNPGTVALEKFPHIAIYERKHAVASDNAALPAISAPLVPAASKTPAAVAVQANTAPTPAKKP